MKIEDDGFIEVEIGGIEKEIDVYDVYNRLLEFRQQVDDTFPDAPQVTHRREFNTRIVTLLAELGFGVVSSRAADRFAVELFSAVDNLGKAEGSGQTPNSPQNTAPTL